MLKQEAEPALLRQQASQGLSAAERQIALHTLLVRDLIASDPATFLQDVALIPADYKEATLPPTRPGNPCPTGMCASRRSSGAERGRPRATTAGIWPRPLAPWCSAPDDGHALNCFPGSICAAGIPISTCGRIA